MKKVFALCVIFVLACNTLCGQNNISGIVLSESGKQPVEYANIGIAGKNIGTATNEKGEYNLSVDSQYDNDSLLFSCIGYDSYSAKISEIKKNGNIFLKEKSYYINEVVIRPKTFKENTLGIKTKSKAVSAGFENSMLGYECGVLMNVKKSAILKKVEINISSCTYDTILYRLNIYKVNGEMNFENILQQPIYVSASKDSLKETLSIDLESQDIIVESDFLVTLEHIKELGEGKMFFCAKLKQKTYFRKTSQGEWQTAPVGVSISVIADVEK